MRGPIRALGYAFVVSLLDRRVVWTSNLKWATDNHHNEGPRAYGFPRQLQAAPDINASDLEVFLARYFPGFETQSEEEFPNLGETRAYRLNLITFEDRDDHDTTMALNAVGATLQFSWVGVDNLRYALVVQEHVTHEIVAYGVLDLVASNDKVNLNSSSATSMEVIFNKLKGVLETTQDVLISPYYARFTTPLARLEFGKKFFFTSTLPLDLGPFSTFMVSLQVVSPIVDNASQICVHLQGENHILYRAATQIEVTEGQGLRFQELSFLALQKTQLTYDMEPSNSADTRQSSPLIYSPSVLTLKLLLEDYLTQLLPKSLRSIHVGTHQNLIHFDDGSFGSMPLNRSCFDYMGPWHTTLPSSEPTLVQLYFSLLALNNSTLSLAGALIADQIHFFDVVPSQSGYAIMNMRSSNGAASQAAHQLFLDTFQHQLYTYTDWAQARIKIIGWSALSFGALEPFNSTFDQSFVDTSLVYRLDARNGSLSLGHSIAISDVEGNMSLVYAVGDLAATPSIDQFGIRFFQYSGSLTLTSYMNSGVKALPFSGLFYSRALFQFDSTGQVLRLKVDEKTEWHVLTTTSTNSE